MIFASTFRSMEIYLLVAAIHFVMSFIVSHEMSFARALAHRVHFVFGGKVEESGTPEELFQAPRSDALKAFIDSIQR